MVSCSQCMFVAMSRLLGQFAICWTLSTFGQALRRQGVRKLTAYMQRTSSSQARVLWLCRKFASPALAMHVDLPCPYACSHAGTR